MCHSHLRLIGGIVYQICKFLYILVSNQVRVNRFLHGSNIAQYNAIIYQDVYMLYCGSHLKVESHSPTRRLDFSHPNYI
jgi:hypothetical protein